MTVIEVNFKLTCNLFLKKLNLQFQQCWSNMKKSNQMEPNVFFFSLWLKIHLVKIIICKTSKKCVRYEKIFTLVYFDAIKHFPN